MSKQRTSEPRKTELTRREFVKLSAATSVLTLAGGCATFSGRGPGILRPEHRPEKIRVGVVGCGGRGTGAAFDCVNAAPNIEIVALGDLFADHLARSREKLAELESKCNVSNERCFVGFDAYQGVLACDIDLVILATPPHFRPPHLAAAVAAGKHVFMEKPVAVDPVGVRSVMGSGEIAGQKGLAIVTGTQRRHDPVYIETMRRIHRGAIGKLVGGQCYWNQGDLWVVDREPGWSDMEWQCRNWLYFTWLSGDHIVEQHVHNIDVINWAMGGPPEKALGSGGRAVRTAAKYGNIYDHFTVEYVYPNGARVLSMCRQIPGTSTRVGELLMGTKGVADPHGEIRAGRRWNYEVPSEPVNPYVQEHSDLIGSIRSGRPLNEARRIAESTLTAIMGRMSAYTGRELSWEWVMNASKLDLSPPVYEFSELPVRAVALPGETKLV